jgi:hypothetical protein
MRKEKKLTSTPFPRYWRVSRPHCEYSILLFTVGLKVKMPARKWGLGSLKIFTLSLELVKALGIEKSLK